jgi:glycosyltransferase involved in cell wall biosynthesis
VRLRILVIIPTYNERENLERLVPKVLQVDEGIEILVVDDNSPDGTGALADALAVSTGRVHVLHRDRKSGLGPAYVAGFRWALAETAAEFIVQMDADFSHDPEFLPEIFAPFHEAKAVVLAIHADIMFEEPVAFRRTGFLTWTDALLAEVVAFKGPVLLVHGDGHRFHVDMPLHLGPQGPLVRNFYRVETFGDPEVAGVLVTVDTTAPVPFQFRPIVPVEPPQVVRNPDMTTLPTLSE